MTTLRIVDRSYCSQSDVERAMGVTAGETNVTQAQILEAIKSASTEVDLITHTTYHNEEDTGTAESGTTTSLTDTDKSWTTDEYANYVLWIYSGTGSGQYANISSNTTDTLTIETVTTAPDSTSKYRIIPDCIVDEDYDGNSTSEFQLFPYPIKSLEALEVAGTTVTPAKVYTYEKEGYLRLQAQLSPEVSYFTDQYPQCVSVTWVYGVYPVPREIKRLTASLAALQCLIQQIGGTYNDVTSYSIPHLTASKGEPYTNIREALTRLEKQVDKGMKYLIKYPQMW